MDFSSTYGHSSFTDVNLWLSELFLDDKVSIPEFEAKEESMKLISEIMFRNKEAEKDAKEIINSEKRLAQFYKEGASEMSGLLNSVLSIKDLSLSARERTEKIAHVACQMDLKEPTLTNFLLITTAAENKKMRFLEKGLTDTYTISKLMLKIRHVIETNRNLKRELEILEKTVNVQQPLTSKINDSSVFISRKAKEYQLQLKTSQKNLKAIGYNSSINHSKLVQRSESVHDLEEKVKCIGSKLESYQCLPPSEMLTRLKIEEAKHELLNLKNEFDMLVNQLT